MGAAAIGVTQTLDGFVVANDQIAQPGRITAVVGLPRAAEDVNVCAFKDDIWPPDAVRGLGSTLTKEQRQDTVCCWSAGC